MRKIIAAITISLVLAGGVVASPAEAHNRRRIRTPASVDVWDRLAICESNNTNDGGAPYYGYWQFGVPAWKSVGETGKPNQYSREHQLAAAKRLQAEYGWGQWPGCARQMGLIPSRRRR